MRRPSPGAVRSHGGTMSELDLGREELRELATRVIAAAGDPTEPFGVYLFLPEEPESELPRSVERAVFDEFFGNSAELLDAEYGDFEPSSYFICVLDHRRRLPAGSGRVTMPSDRGFKTLVDIESIWRRPIQDVVAHTELDWDIDVVWDAVTIAVAPEYRGKATDGLISLSMLQAGTMGMRMCGGRIWVAILDLDARAAINAAIHDAWQPFADLAPMRYLDSPLSIPCFVDTSAFEPTLQAADPIMHDIIYRGIGIEAMVRPPEFDPLLQRMAVRPQPPATR
jgi:hypothetical protein